MQRQPVAYARSLHRGSYVVAALAITLFATSARHDGGALLRGASPSMHEAPIDTPLDWATLPSIAHWDPEHVVSGRDHSFFSSSTLAVATLGAVSVRYRLDACGWGGSACAGSSTTLRDLRFGSLDEHGEPAFPLAFACTTTSPFESYPKPARRSCAPESLAVRSDGTRFVLTVRDPDAVEAPIAAIARTPARTLGSWPLPSWTVDRLLLAALAVALFVASAGALARARRFFRRGGVLSWIPRAIGGSDVLVDPRAPSTGTAYRDLDLPAAEHVYAGTVARAARHAERWSFLALLALLASALVSVVATLAY